MECDSVYDAEHEIDYQCEPEIHECRYIFGQQEHILGDIDLRKDLGIVHKRIHSVLCRFLVIRKDNIAAEKIYCIVRYIFCEELREYDLHDEKRKERRENTPPHAQYAALVLLREIAMYQLLEKKTIFL